MNTSVNYNSIINQTIDKTDENDLNAINQNYGIGWEGTLRDFIKKYVKIADILKKSIGKEFEDSEYKSWSNSLPALAKVLKESNLPPDINVLCEYQLARLPYRCDVILLGKKECQDKALIIELKQWSKGKVKPLNQDSYPGYVYIDVEELRERLRYCKHPSIQVSRYEKFLQNHYDNIQDPDEPYQKGLLQVRSCAFLHNYVFSESREKDALIIGFEDCTKEEKSPVFGQGQKEQEKFINFIKKEIDGPSESSLDKLKNSNISYNDAFFDSICNILDNKEVFPSSETQLDVINGIVDKLKKNSTENNVFFVDGGPGTGKTVVAFNLLLKIKENLKWNEIAYVTTNWSFLEACDEALKKNSATETQSGIKYLNLRKKGNNSLQEYVESKRKSDESFKFDCLVVDEAQQLISDDSSYTFQVANSTKNIIFILDDNQALVPRDIGSSDLIEKEAKTIYYKDKPQTYRNYRLTGQFPNGSSQYINWIEGFLGYKDNSEVFKGIQLNNCGYDFEVVDDPKELFEWVKDKRDKKHTACVLAGSCWPITKKEDFDIEIARRGKPPYYANWCSSSNVIDDLAPDKPSYIAKVVGQEFDYVGVIIGPDLDFEGGKVTPKPDKNVLFSVFNEIEGVEEDKVMKQVPRHRTNAYYWQKIESAHQLTSYSELEEYFKEVPVVTLESDYTNEIYYSCDPPMAVNSIRKLDLQSIYRMIRNQYRVLLTRGRKGCHVFCVDNGLQEYLKRLVKKQCAYENQELSLKKRLDDKLKNRKLPLWSRSKKR